MLFGSSPLALCSSDDAHGWWLYDTTQAQAYIRKELVDSTFDPLEMAEMLLRNDEDTKGNFAGLSDLPEPCAHGCVDNEGVAIQAGSFLDFFRGIRMCVLCVVTQSRLCVNMPERSRRSRDGYETLTDPHL